MSKIGVADPSGFAQTIIPPDPALFLTLNAYQTLARETAIYPANVKVIYPAMSLAEEAGEVAGKVSKLLRKHGTVENMPNDVRTAIVKEVGDVFWQAVNLLADLGVLAGDCAQMNLDKLKDRKERGVLDGSGDNR